MEGPGRQICGFWIYLYPSSLLKLTYFKQDAEAETENKIF